MTTNDDEKKNWKIAEDAFAKKKFFSFFFSFLRFCNFLLSLFPFPSSIFFLPYRSKMNKRRGRRKKKNFFCKDRTIDQSEQGKFYFLQRPTIDQSEHGKFFLSKNRTIDQSERGKFFFDKDRTIDQSEKFIYSNDSITNVFLLSFVCSLLLLLW